MPKPTHLLFAALLLAAPEAFAQQAPEPVVAPPLRLSASGAPAPAAPPDRVFLYDGNVLQGRVTELRSGQSVTLVTADGVPRVVPWVYVRYADGPAFPGTYRAGFYTPLTPPAGPAEPVHVPSNVAPPAGLDADLRRTAGDGEVPVEFVSPGGQQAVGIVIGLPFRVVTGRNAQWYPAPASMRCRTPCTLYVPAGRVLFRAMGETVDSRDFLADVPSSGVRYQLASPPLYSRLAAAWLIIGGIAFAVVGGPVLAIGALFHSVAMEASGGVIGGVGLGALGAGIGMLVRYRGGIERVSPLSPTVGFGPVPGGAMGTLALRF